MTHITFFGLGHMGMPMVQNLLNASFKVTVFDIVIEKMTALASQGAMMANSVKEACIDADVIFTMLQTGEEVKKICLQDGIFQYAKKNVLYIDCSSIDMVTSRELHQIAQENGIACLDAPVSGGVAGATAGTLTFMVGGDEKNFLRAKPILEKCGKQIIHAGVGGLGQSAKICNNLLLAISMIGTCEAFSLAEKLGLDLKKFYEISSNASGQCWSMTTYCPVPGILEKSPANNKYKPGFMAKMMLKDLHLANHAAENVQATIPLATVAMELYTLFVNQGNGEIDFSGIFQMITENKRGVFTTKG